METKRVTANGVDFAYLEKGEGPLVLCLHGFPDYAPTWIGLLDALAEAGFRGVAPWMRGYSPTGTADRYHTQYLALDAIALTEALAGDGDAFLVGTDWGAGAVNLAVPHRPDLWKRCVTMAVPPQGAIGDGFLSDPAQWKRSWYVWFFGTPVADVVFTAADFAIIDTLYADWSPSLKVDDAFMRGLKDTFAVDGGQAAMGYYRDSFHARRAVEGEAQNVTGGPITIPQLYFHGTEDGCLGFDLIDEEKLEEALGPHGEYVVVEGAGHFLHLEKPDEVNTKIIDFLKA